MRSLCAFIFCLAQSILFGQGTFLEYGDSGAILGYRSYEVEIERTFDRVRTRRLHSVHYGYSIKRKVDVELEAGKLGGNNLFGGSFSAYTGNDGPLNARASLIISKVITRNSELLKAGNITFFYSQSNEYLGVIPRFGFTVSGSETYASNFGIDFRLGGKQAGLIFGVDFILPSEGRNYLGLNVGIIFIDRNRKKTIE